MTAAIWGNHRLYIYDFDCETGFCLIPSVPYGWQPVGETVGIPSKQTITSDVIIACIDRDILLA